MTYGDRQFFSTKSLPSQRSLRVWRECMREVWFNLDIHARGTDAFSGELAKRPLLSMHASEMVADAHRVIRSKELASLDNDESFCLVFPIRGSFEYRQRNRSAVARWGDVYILNASEKYEVDISHKSRMLCLTLPCDALRAKISNVDDLCGKSGFADPALVATLRELVRGILHTEPTVDALRVQNLCIEIIDLMLTGNPMELSSSHVDAIAARLIDHATLIARMRLGDPELNVSEVARACAVSVRKLQSSYQEMGTTFGRELLNLRLNRAHNILNSNNEWSRRISSVALECGFSSLAHFSSCYKKRYGRSPREERSQIL